MVKIRILVIDDEPRWVEFAKNSLVDFQIVAVDNTDEALKLLVENQFDLVIVSSLQLNALEKIKQEYKDKPLFVTSSEPTRNEQRSAYLIGARRYMPKTFDPENLKDEIKQVVSKAN